jgi:hypothetical protein
VYLRRMRNGVRSAPSEDRYRPPAFDPALGAPAPAGSAAPETQGMCCTRTEQSCEQAPASLCRHHILVVLSRILQPASNDPSHPRSMPPTQPDGGGTAPELGRADGSACPRPRPSSRQHSLAPGDPAKCTRNHAGPNMRFGPGGDGARVFEKQSRTDPSAAAYRDGPQPSLLSQPSQHLPFPFRNARVEVGRTVMEG